MTSQDSKANFGDLAIFCQQTVLTRMMKLSREVQFIKTNFRLFINYKFLRVFNNSIIF